MRMRFTTFSPAVARVAIVVLALSSAGTVGFATASQASPVRPHSAAPAAAPAVATPAISAPPDLVVGEADGFVDLPVTLDAPGTSQVKVLYETLNSTATTGTNCTQSNPPPAYVGVGPNGTLTFLPGQTTRVIRVDLLDCTQPGLRSFVLNLYTPTGATLARATTRIDIVGDAAAGDTPALYVRDATVDHSAGTINVPVLLGGPPGDATTTPTTVTVDYTTVDGTARAGTDYTLLGDGTLTFNPGQTVKNIPVAITNRAGNLPARRFAITLANPQHATLADATGTVVIGASGAPAIATPAISAPPDLVVGEADGFVDLPVTLDAPGTSQVKVLYETLNSTATTGTNCTQSNPPPAYVGVGPNGTLTFLPGQTTRVIRVDLLDCTQPGLRSFVLNLYTPTGATLARHATTITITSTPEDPGAPTGVKAVPGDRQAVVSFAPPATDGGNPINTYTVTAHPGPATASGPASPLTVSGLTDGVAYTFTVTAINAIGTGPPSALSNAVTPGGVPGAPTGLAAVGGDATVKLSWTAPASNGGHPITTYDVYVGTGPGKESLTPINAGPVTTYTVKGLTDATTYYLVVKAHNGLGNSAASNEVAATPWAATFSPPAPPPRRFLATDIAVGANGTVWYLGVSNLVGGHDIYKTHGLPFPWTPGPVPGSAVTVAVDPHGNALVIRAGHQIYHWTGSGWTPLRGAATDIAVGANGVIWMVGTNSLSGGHSVYRWNGTGWSVVQGAAAVTIAVDPQGKAWIVDTSHHIKRWTGSGWVPVGGAATDIAIGANGAVWIIGANNLPGGHGIYRLTGTTWARAATAAVTIAVDPHGNPWIINASHQILFG
jgi:hypothetical protein